MAHLDESGDVVLDSGEKYLGEGLGGTVSYKDANGIIKYMSPSPTAPSAVNNPYNKPINTYQSPETKTPYFNTGGGNLNLLGLGLKPGNPGITNPWTAPNPSYVDYSVPVYNESQYKTATGGNMSDSLSDLYQPTALQQQISGLLMNQYNQPNPYQTGEGKDYGRMLSEMSRTGGGVGSLADALAKQYGSTPMPDTTSGLSAYQQPMDFGADLRGRMDIPATQMTLDPQTQALMAQFAQGGLTAPEINLSSETQALMSRMANAQGTIDPAFQAAREAEGQIAMNRYIQNLAALNQGSIPTNAIIAGGQETARGIGRDLTQYQLQSQQQAQQQNQAALSGGLTVAQGNAQLLAQIQALNSARQESAMKAGFGMAETNANLSAQDIARKDQLTAALTKLSEDEFARTYGVTKDIAAAQWQQYEANLQNQQYQTGLRMQGAQSQFANTLAAANQMGSWLGQGNQYDLSKAGLLTDLYSGEKSQQDLAMQRYLQEQSIKAQNENQNKSLLVQLFGNAFQLAPYAIKELYGLGGGGNQSGNPSPTAQDYYNQHPDWYMEDYT